MKEKLTLEQRFWAKVDKEHLSCWRWKAQADDKGYGRFQIGNASQRAHRVSYAMVHGPIPEGLVIDHLCKNKLCVNPNHLEPVPSRVNTLRARNTLAYINSDKHQCPKGHPYLAENLVVSKNGYNGARRCKKCKNEQERARDRASRPHTGKYLYP